MTRLTETRDVSDFSEIIIEGFGDAEVEQTGVESLEIEADDALLDRLKAEVRNGKLYLGLDIEWWEWLTYWATWAALPDKRVHYRITTKAFDGAQIKGSGSLVAGPIQTENCALGISGSGKMRLEQITADTIETRISGSGEFKLGGEASKLSSHISGSGDVLAATLEAQEVSIRISGSGKAHVNAQESLEVHISGSGEVRYLGAPQIDQHISGAGSIRALKTT